MPVPHIDDETLDQYALGSLPENQLAEVEEHLLTCESCQSRLGESDEFIGLFRVAATHPEARSQPFWRVLFSPRVLVPATGAAVLSAGLVLVAVEQRKSPGPPATVLMQAFRGPDSPTAIPARKPAVLVFDLTPAGPAGDYQAEVVNLVGKRILTAALELRDSKLGLTVQKLDPGSYWVRIYRKSHGELIAEYGLRAE